MSYTILGQAFKLRNFFMINNFLLVGHPVRNIEVKLNFFNQNTVFTKNLYKKDF